jgi:ribosomal protein S3AE
LNFGRENELGVFVNNIINGELAKELFKKVKGIHPIRRVEIIKTKVELPTSSQ